LIVIFIDQEEPSIAMAAFSSVAIAIDGALRPD